ncbi:MAG: hypothetical protein ABI441_18320 [Flavobacterium sp.]
MKPHNYTNQDQDERYAAEKAESTIEQNQHENTNQEYKSTKEQLSCWGEY